MSLEDKFPFHLEPKSLGSETAIQNTLGLPHGMADGLSFTQLKTPILADLVIGEVLHPIA